MDILVITGKDRKYSTRNYSEHGKEILDWLESVDPEPSPELIEALAKESGHDPEKIRESISFAPDHQAQCLKSERRRSRVRDTIWAKVSKLSGPGVKEPIEHITGRDGAGYCVCGALSADEKLMRLVEWLPETSAIEGKTTYNITEEIEFVYY